MALYIQRNQHLKETMSLSREEPQEEKLLTPRFVKHLRPSQGTTRSVKDHQPLGDTANSDSRP